MSETTPGANTLGLNSRITEHSAPAITQALLAGSEVLHATALGLNVQVMDAGTLLCQTVDEGRQVLACGNGGSAADAQHFVAELVGRYRSDRAAWRAIALTVDPSIVTAIANDYGFAEVFARQVAAHGREGDVLVALSTSGSSPNVLRAAETAKHNSMHVIALTGAKTSALAELADVALCVPSLDTPLIQQAHIAILHVLCELLEARFCGDS